MPILETSYTPWQGKALDKPRVWLIIARTGIRLAWNKATALLLFVASIPFLVRAGQIYLSSKLLEEDSASEISRMIEVRPDLFMDFMRDQMAILLVLLAVVGAGLIANDRRYKALALYFSKPVSVTDYIMGKFSVVLVYFGLVTVVPALLLYLLQIVITVEPGFFAEYYWLPFSIIAQTVAGVIVLGSLLLAVSSCAKGTRSAIVAFFALLLIPAFIAELMFRVHDIGWISVTRNLRQISAFLYGERAPYRYPAWAAALAWIAVTGASLLALKLRIKPTEVVK